MCPRSRLIEVGREVGGECDERRQEKERELADILTEARDFPSLSDARRPFPRIFVCVPSSSRSRSREGKYIARGSATRGGKSRRGRINEEFARTLSLSLSLSLLFSSPLSPLLAVSRQIHGHRGEYPGDTGRDTPRKLACVFPWMWM